MAGKTGYEEADVGSDSVRVPEVFPRASAARGSVGEIGAHHAGAAPGGSDPSRSSDQMPVAKERYDFRPRGVAARLERRMYPGGRPNRLARLLNRWWAFAHGTGLLPKKHVTLEVPGRRTGRRLSFPLVMTHYQGERYLVSMLGDDSNWVRNVRAAGGRATLHHGRREPVLLEDVNPDARAPIVRRYLSLAPGPRAFIPVDRDAPFEEFAKVAPQIPVFRVTTDRSARDRTRSSSFAIGNYGR